MVTQRKTRVTAENVEEWLDALDKDPDFRLKDAAPLRVIIEARERVENAEELLVESVREARAAGMSWAEIGVALGGVSRQAAEQRFG